MIPALAPCFTGPLAPYAGLVREEADAAEALPGRALLEEATVPGLVARFGAAYPGADPRAIVSYWSQWYFGALIVPAAAALIRLDRALPVALDAVRLELKADGTPAAFLVAHAGGTGSGFADLVDGHVAPLVAHVAGLYGLPRRVLWANAAVYLDWTMRQAEGCGACAPGPLAACRALLGGRTDAQGRANPLCGAVGRAGRPRPEAGCRRRVCCLRYRLPGVPGCGDRCPLDAASA